MKQVKILDEINLMLEAVVKDERKKGNLGANKQSVVNELIIARHKRINKS